MNSSARSDIVERVDWRVYVVVDPRAVPDGHDLLATAEAALDGGAGVLQLRDKVSDGRTLLGRADAFRRLCERYAAAFVVNDRLDIALASGADGVHLGPDDMSVDRARWVAPDMIIGASAGTSRAAQHLVGQGADYVGVGAIYEARPSKADASGPRGPAAIAAVAAGVDRPVVGIGGIDAGRAAEVIKAGADGVAVIREVVASDTPKQAARRLVEAVDAGLKAR